MAFYDRLADEIDQACDQKRIPCGPPRATLMPVFYWRYVADTARDLPLIGGVIFTMGNQEIGSAPSEGPPSELAVFQDMVGDLYPAHGAEGVLQGWVASPSGKPEVTLLNRAKDQVDTAISTFPGDDVTAAFPGWLARRFDIRTSCPPAECDLVIRAPDGSVASVPLPAAHPGPAVTNSSLRVFFDYAALHDVRAASALRRSIVLKIAHGIAWVYSHAFPPLAIAAAVGLVVAVMKIRSRIVPISLIAMALASVAAIAGRALLLAYLDVTSIPSHSILYASPASPFVVIFTVLGCWSLWKCLVPHRPR